MYTLDVKNLSFKGVEQVGVRAIINSADYCVPLPFQRHINYLQAVKWHTFGNTIALFDFFCYGNWGAYDPYYTQWSLGAPQTGNFYSGFSGVTEQNATPDHMPRYNMVKMDTVIERTASQAAKKYRDAILPRALQSIEIKIKSDVNARDNQKAQDATLAKNCTGILQWYIEKAVPNFMEVIKCVVSDYINYGNCCIQYFYDQNNKRIVFKHLPFQQCFFGNKYPESEFSFMFREIVSAKMAIKMGYRKLAESTDNQNRQVVIDYLIVSREIYEDLQQEYRDLLKDESQIIPLRENYVMLTLADNGNVLLNSQPLKNSSIYIARNDVAHNYQLTNYLSNYNNLGMNATYYGLGNISLGSRLQLNTYGRGAGIKAIGNVTQANLAMQLKTTGSIMSIYPAYLATLGVEVNKGTAMEGHLDISPGRLNTVSKPTASGIMDGGGNVTLTPISDSQHIVVSFNEDYATHIKQIEIAFNTEIFSMLNEQGRNVTATEISIRSQEATQTFRGETSAFYGECLLALINQILEDLIKNPEYGLGIISQEDQKYLKGLIEKKYKIKIFSFEDEKIQMAKEARLTERIGVMAQIGGLVQQGLQVPNFEQNMADLIKSYMELNID